MQVSAIFFAFLLVGTVLGIGPFNDASWQNLFCKIAIFGISDVIECDNMKDTLTFKNGGGVNITMNPSTDTITFTVNTTSIALESLSNVTDIGCATGQQLQVNSSGIWACVTPTSGGEANTASNVGTGEASVFKQKSGVDLQFKKLKQGANVVLTNGTDDVTIAVSGVGTGNATMFNDLGDVSLSGVASGHIVQVVNGYWQNKLFKSNSMTCSGSDKISSYDNATGSFTCATDSSGTDTNTAQIGNSGNGVSLFGSRINATQNNLKTLRAGTGISLSSNSTDVSITSTVTDTNTAQIVSAGGTSLFKSRDNATQNTIKGLTTTRGITLTGNTNDVQVDTNFKVNTKSSATRQFLVSFNNATTSGDFGTTTFGVNTQSCSAGNHISAINNSTGAVSCSADTTGITSINSDSTTAQVFSGTAGNITITDTGAGTLQFNTAGNIATVQGSQTFLNKDLSSATNTFPSSLSTNTAQIVSAGGTSLFKSRDNATQNTIKGLTTTRGITLTGNTNDVQVDTNFKVNTKSSATRQFLVSFNNATTSGDFGTTTFGVNTQSCSAGNHISAINNSTGAVSCSADTGGTDTNTAQIVSAGGTSLFKSRDNATQNTIKGLTTTRGITLTGNTNDVQVDTNFKVNTVSSGIRQFLVSFNNATTSGNFGTTTFGIDNISTTCSGTDKVSAIILNNSTGDWTITCSTDQTGAGGGFTKVNNVGTGTIKLVQTNSSNTANIKSITTTRGLTLTNGSTTAQIDTNFKVNSITAQNKVWLTGFNNATTSGDFTTRTFALNNQTVAKDFQIVGINNSTGVVTRNQFSVNTNDCGSNFVKSIDNATGYITCAAAGGGSTAWAKSAVRKTADYTATTSDGTIIVDSYGGNRTITLPSASGSSGQLINIFRNDTGASRNWVMVKTTSPDSLDNSNNWNLTQNKQALKVQSNGTKWFGLNKDESNNGNLPIIPTKGTGYNRWWQPQHISNTALATLLAQTAAIQAYPFVLSSTTTFDRGEIDVSALLAGSTCRIGIYTSDHRGYPFKLISGTDIGTISTAATGRVGSTFTTPITLDAGLYYTAVQCSSAATLTLRANPVAAQADILGFGSGTAPATSAGFTLTRAYAAFPTNFGTPTGYLGAVSQHAVFLRATG